MVLERRNYYQILGLPPESSTLEIKRAYRALVKNCHPDIEWTHGRSKEVATEEMTRLNEAYETLKDKSRRAAYDSLIGANGRGAKHVMPYDDDLDEARQRYLKQAFHPARQSVNKLLNKYKQQLLDLSQDPYDEKLLEEFEEYGNEVERVLSKAAQTLSSMKPPKSLSPAELMMRYAIAQAADGLDELRHFLRNYNYAHLSIADNLFSEYSALSKKALALTKWL